MPTGYADSGALVVAADRDDAEELRRLHAFQRELGLESEWLAPARRAAPGAGPLAAHRRRDPRARRTARSSRGAVVAALAAALRARGRRAARRARRSSGC